MENFIGHKIAKVRFVARGPELGTGYSMTVEGRMGGKPVAVEISGSSRDPDRLKIDSITDSNGIPAAVLEGNKIITIEGKNITRPPWEGESETAPPISPESYRVPDVDAINSLPPIQLKRFEIGINRLLERAVSERGEAILKDIVRPVPHVKDRNQVPDQARAGEAGISTSIKGGENHEGDPFPPNGPRQGNTRMR
jgi:hypothetical protein